MAMIIIILMVEGKIALFSRHVCTEMKAWLYLLLLGALSASSDLVGESRAFFSTFPYVILFLNDLSV